MRFIVMIVLIALLSMLHFHLWRQGSGVVAHHISLQNKLEQEKEHTQRLNMRNARLQAEIQDLTEGVEIVEELARQDLKMIKPNEVLIQYK